MSASLDNEQKKVPVAADISVRLGNDSFLKSRSAELFQGEYGFGFIANHSTSVRSIVISFPNLVKQAGHHRLIYKIDYHPSNRLWQLQNEEVNLPAETGSAEVTTIKTGIGFSMEGTFRMKLMNSSEEAEGDFEISVS